MDKNRSKPVVYCPIFFNIQGRRCVVVGGGKVALRKVRMLLDCGADITVISPTSHPGITKLSEKRAIHLIERDFKTEDLKGAAMAIATTDKKEVNRKVAVEAKRAGVWVNVADDPGPSDFIIPSFFRQGDLTVAVSTAGVSPALARKIRTQLEKSFGEEYAMLLSLIGEVRSTLKGRGIIVSREVWQKALNLDLLISLIRSSEREKAKAFLLRKLEVHPS